MDVDNHSKWDPCTLIWGVCGDFDADLPFKGISVPDLIPFDQLLLIVGMALVTYIPRAAPLMLLSSRELNPLLLRWLEMVPPAVLAALLAPEVLLRKSSGGEFLLFLSLDNVFLLAAVPTFLVGWIGKSFFATVAFGMVCVAVLRYLV
jgi:branched-subunit amino acid transport protein